MKPKGGPIRVAIAGLHTETNTFSAVVPDLSPVNTAGVLRGSQIVEHFGASHHMLAGMLRACEQEGVEGVPLVYANAMACGTLPGAELERVCTEILSGLAEHGPFDVVLLAGHGAAVSEPHLDAEGELAARVRAAVGRGVVVATGLDLHGNITDRLIDAVDLAVGYREYPHRDPVVRGDECALLAIREARGEIRPVQALVRLPMVVPVLGGATAAEPMCEIMAAAERIAAEHILLSFTVFHGFPYSDVPHMGSSVLAVSDGDLEAAQRAADAIADRLWAERERLCAEILAPGDAVAEAAARAADGRGPVVLLDVGDNIGGGSPGDSTVLLAEALARNVRGFTMSLCDKDAVAQARAVGEGAEVELEVGGATPVSVGPRLRVRGIVTRVTDGRFEDPNPTHAGFRFYDGGPTVRLTTPAGQDVVISSRTVPSQSPEQLRAVGIEPREQHVIVAKGVIAPRAGYEPVAGDFILVDTPGVTAADLSALPFRRRPVPLWPFEHDATREQE